MRKNEFLEELEVSLIGDLPSEEICQILADYADIFTCGAAGGKSEEQVAAEIGSPARIAKTILEDDSVPKQEQVYAQKEPLPMANLASMGARLAAYLLDVLMIGGVFVFLGLLFFALDTASMRSRYTISYDFLSTIHQFIPLITLFIIGGGGFFISSLFVYFTNGYTPGKWFLKIRIVKLDGSRIRFSEALLRECVIKTIANAICSGILNIGSFIFGCCTPEHKTVHDLALRTTVVNVFRYKGN